MAWTWPWTPVLTATELRTMIMGAVQDAVDTITTQLGKARDEILDKISDLEAQIAAGETPDLGPLVAAAQALDNIVEDVVIEEPPVEPPVV